MLISQGDGGKPRNMSLNVSVQMEIAQENKDVWQRRFWEHCIRNEEDWQRHMDYIHYNPVKHGLSSSPAQWPHSSFHKAVAAGWYDVNWGNIGQPETIYQMEME